MTSKGGGAAMDRLKVLSTKPRKQKSFRLSSRQGGFRVGSLPDAVEPRRSVEVLVAYDRRGGSPLKKFSTADFRLDQNPIHIESTNAITEIRDANHLLIYPLADEFSVVVTGFDLNRDLFLQARNSQQANNAIKAASSPQLQHAHS